MNKQLTETDRAYIAGLLDGEGTLVIYKQNRSRWGNKSMAYRGLVSIANTNVPMLLKVKGLIGGKIVEQGLGKKCFSLTFTVGEVRKWLPDVVDFLVAKKKQAEIMLRFLNRMLQHGFNPVNQELVEFYEKCLTEIKSMKKERFSFKEEFKILGVRECEFCKGSFVITSKSPLKRFCKKSCKSNAGVKRFLEKRNLV